MSQLTQIVLRPNEFQVIKGLIVKLCCS